LAIRFPELIEQWKGILLAELNIENEAEAIPQVRQSKNLLCPRFRCHLV